MERQRERSGRVVEREWGQGRARKREGEREIEEKKASEEIKTKHAV